MARDTQQIDEVAQLRYVGILIVAGVLDYALAPWIMAIRDAGEKTRNR